MTAKKANFGEHSALLDMIMCARSDHAAREAGYENCQRRSTCRRSLPDGPVDPRQNVVDFFGQWGNLCPFYSHRPKEEST